MGMATRRTVLKGTAALAGAAAVTTAGLSSAAQAAPAHTGRSHPKPNVLLVHGAWKTLPSWALVSTQDRMINPDLERFMAKRAGATTIEVRSSHASPASHPDKVAGLIVAAARAART